MAQTAEQINIKEKSKYMIERIVVKLIQKIEKEAFESQFTNNYNGKVRFVDTNKEIVISDDSKSE